MAKITFTIEDVEVDGRSGVHSDIDHDLPTDPSHPDAEKPPTPAMMVAFAMMRTLMAEMNSGGLALASIEGKEG